MIATIRSFFTRVFRHREFWITLPIYFFLSLTNLVLKIHPFPDWTDGTLDGKHNLLMAFQFTNNEQSRLLQFLVPEFFHRVFGIYIVSSYALARLLFVFLAFVAFHFFLRKWFSQAESLLGVIILSGSLAVTFLIEDTQESAPLLMFLFILALWALRERKDWLFGVLLWLGGGLTNETMLALAAAYFFFRLTSFKFKDLLKSGWATALVSAPAFLTQGVIRYINRNQPHLGGAWHLPDNLRGLYFVLINPIKPIFQHGIYIYPLLIFSIFWIYAAIGYKKSPRFFQAVFWMMPLFILAHLLTGLIDEARQMIPLGFIVIPMSLFLIFPKAIPAGKWPRTDEAEQAGSCSAQEDAAHAASQADPVPMTR